MSRIAIKRKNKIKKVRVPYDAELNDLREWQDNMYNPGHYVGTGKIPYPLKHLTRRTERNLSRYPKIKRAYLFYFLLLIIIILFNMDLVWYKTLPALLAISVIVFIIYDSNRIIKKKYKN